MPAAPLASEWPSRPDDSAHHDTEALPALRILFASQTSSIHGYGCFKRIALPAHDLTAAPGNTGNAFSHAIATAIESARRRGITYPVIMGALPFDLSQGSDLFIPQSCIRTPREIPEAGGAIRTLASLPRRRAAVSTPDRAGYMEAVRRAAALIRGNALQKVVLARELAVEFDTAISLDAVFNRLVTLNPGVTHFQVPLNQGGTLLGASPELLLRREGRRVMCNPLAGSARRVADPAKDAAIGAALLASPKDRHEHSFVVAQIKEALAPVCDSLHVPPEPSLVQTAQMWHLGTHIEGILSDTGLGALDLALLLHPTPAVCGTPTQEACDIINKLEPFDRGTFAGAVGWSDDKGDGEWAVTIRCGIVEDRKIRLYAGAGIVRESDPEMEWAETEAKLGTMLTVLGLADQHP